MKSNPLSINDTPCMSMSGQNQTEMIHGSSMGFKCNGLVFKLKLGGDAYWHMGVAAPYCKMHFVLMIFSIVQLHTAQCCLNFLLSNSISLFVPVKKLC